MSRARSFYCIQFDDGVTKLGSSGGCSARFRQLQCDRRHLIVKSFVSNRSEACTFKVEARMIAAAARLWPVAEGRESFYGVPFDDAVALVRQFADGPIAESLWASRPGWNLERLWSLHPST